MEVALETERWNQLGLTILSKLEASVPIEKIAGKFLETMHMNLLFYL